MIFELPFLISIKNQHWIFKFVMVLNELKFLIESNESTKFQI